MPKSRKKINFPHHRFIETSRRYAVICAGSVPPAALGGIYAETRRLLRHLAAGPADSANILLRDIDRPGQRVGISDLPSGTPRRTATVHPLDPRHQSPPASREKTTLQKIDAKALLCHVPLKLIVKRGSWAN